MELILCEVGDPEVPGLESLSPFCIKVHRALRHLGMPYERRHGRGPGDFSDLNPVGQVPVLIVDGEPVSDSTTILQRIGVAGPAEAWLWEEFAAVSVERSAQGDPGRGLPGWPRIRQDVVARAGGPAPACECGDQVARK